MLTIGDLSKTTGVKVPTIRYYEQMGLLSHTERSEGNQRRYSKTEGERLSFIKHARELGLTIEAIRELIDLSQHPEKPCEEADGIAAKQLVTVREKIQRLKIGSRTGADLNALQFQPGTRLLRNSGSCQPLSLLDGTRLTGCSFRATFRSSRLQSG